MTQSEFAELIGKNQPYVSALETGAMNASWAMAKKIADKTFTRPDLWMPGGDVSMRKDARECAVGQVEQLWRRNFGHKK